MAGSTTEPQEREMVHVKLDSALVRQIDHLAVDWRMFRNQAMETVLKEGLRSLDQKKRMAV